MSFKPKVDEKLQLKDIKLNVYEFEHKEGRPTAIVLHGLRNDTLKNYPLISLLEEHYNVVAFDFPGHGKSTEYTEFRNYIEYCAETLNEFIKKKEIDTSNTIITGGSFGANVIIKFITKYSDYEFKKIGLLVPLYSEDTLSISANKKKLILGLAKALAKNGWFTKFFQKAVDSKILIGLLLILYYRSLDLQFIAHEIRLWHICPLELWGRAVYDTLTIDNSKMKKHHESEHITFVYPKKDQYLDVTKVTSAYKRIFPFAKFKTYISETHMPRGDWSKNKEFMDSMREVVFSTLD